MNCDKLSITKLIIGRVKVKTSTNLELQIVIIKLAEHVLIVSIQNQQVEVTLLMKQPLAIKQPDEIEHFERNVINKEIGFN